MNGISLEGKKLLNDKWLNSVSKIVYQRTKRQKIPLKDKKNILITSALPYVNNVPHLGNIIGCVLSGDVYSRYCRLKNYNSLYICGTDEYGTATETKAIEENLTPEQICEKYHKIHLSVYEWFQIDFDYFGRTTTALQTEIAQDIFNDLHSNGLLLEENVEQLYCQRCIRYLADRFVYGICPHCSYTDARGDQCDKCGKLVNAIDLKEPICKVCKSKPVQKTSKHLFLDLPKLETDLKKWTEEAMNKGTWTDCSKSITASWIRDGLKPRCITRDLKWGTRVPLKGFEDKVFYVWFDAPIGYLSITANYTTEWKKWWMNPDQVRLTQFMAKDNVPFHTIIFPCSLIGTRKNYTLLSDISAIEYLNYENDKFSKSRGIGVFGDNAQQSGIPSDIFRFYLILSRPETSDTSFSWTDLQLKYHGNLINNLGNFVNRTLQFVKNNFNSAIPSYSGQYTDSDFLYISDVNKHLKFFNDSMNNLKSRDAINFLLEISRCGNQYFQKMEPWKLIKQPDKKTRVSDVVYILSQSVSLICPLLEPFMPSTSASLSKYLNLEISDMTIPEEFLPFLPSGHIINDIEPLFSKIENETISNLQNIYSNKLKKEIVKQSQSYSTPVKDISQCLENLDIEIAKQGNIVRDLKKSFADTALINKEVGILLYLKKKRSIK